MDTATALLETVDLSVSFGGIRALDGLDLSVPEGRLVGLIGPNGAGKTTTIDALTGFVRARGAIRFGGDEIGARSVHERARAGLVRTWQSLELFDDLTIEENCRVAAAPPTVRDALSDLVHPSRERDIEQVEWALELLGLTDVGHRLPAKLSLGRRKLAGVARALASRPRLVLLDEPAAGLDSTESRKLGEQLREVVAEGVTLLLVDHDMGLVLSVCDEVNVLEFGRLIAHGTPDQIRENPDVVAAYLGESGGLVGGSTTS